MHISPVIRYNFSWHFPVSQCIFAPNKRFWNLCCNFKFILGTINETVSQKFLKAKLFNTLVEKKRRLQKKKNESFKTNNPSNHFRRFFFFFSVACCALLFGTVSRLFTFWFDETPFFKFWSCTFLKNPSEHKGSQKERQISSLLQNAGFHQTSYTASFQFTAKRFQSKILQIAPSMTYFWSTAKFKFCKLWVKLLKKRRTPFWGNENFKKVSLLNVQTSM